MAIGAAKYSNTPGFGVRPAILEDYSSWGNQPTLLDADGNRLATPVVSGSGVLPQNASDAADTKTHMHVLHVTARMRFSL